MIQAFRHLIKQQPPEINYKIIKKSLFTSELPPVDLIIRTGGEPHNSAGFMMWHTAYSQYYFTPTYFPDFDKKELSKAINDYSKRKRRYGA
jgi:undecaprenyl diphosphate synthase